MDGKSDARHGVTTAEIVATRAFQAPQLSAAFRVKAARLLFDSSPTAHSFVHLYVGFAITTRRGVEAAEVLM